MKTKSTVCDERYKGYCFFCGRPVFGEEHHLLFGKGIRDKAEQDGLKVPICDDCHTTGIKIERIHDNPMAEKLSKMLGQMAYERNIIAEKGCSIEQAREYFRARYGKTYF